MSVTTASHDTSTGPAPGPTADPTAGPTADPSRLLVVLPWALAVLALALAAFTTARWQALQAAEDDRQGVTVAATAFLVELVNWDASDGLDDTVAELRGRGTGRFLAQAEDLFGGPLGDELEVADAVSEGRIEDLFVQAVDGDRAEVFAVVSQSVSSTVTSGSERTVRRVILHLERVGGDWRVENLELPELVVGPGGDEEG